MICLGGQVLLHRVICQLQMSAPKLSLPNAQGDQPDEACHSGASTSMVDSKKSLPERAWFPVWWAWPLGDDQDGSVDLWCFVCLG